MTIVEMDLIGSAGKVISLIEAGITVSDQLKGIAKSEHKLPPGLENLYNNAQHLLEIIEALPSSGISSSHDSKVGLLADKARNISNKVIAVMNKINPDWRQKRGAPLALWRSYLKQKEMQSIEKDFESLRERMKLALLDLVCQSSSEAKLQYEELRKGFTLGNEHVTSIQGLMHEFNQRLGTVQNSIYNLAKQVGPASLTEDDFRGRAVELLISERKLSIILERLTTGFQEKDLKVNAIAKSDPGTFDWMTQGLDYCQEDPGNLNDKERLAYDSCDPDMLQNHIEASNNLRSYLQGPPGAFLILGKPGSGKSTLMKYLMHNSLVLQDLEQWAAKSNKRLIRAIFFFSVTQGSGALSSEESLYRSLLFQCLRECPALVDEILPGEANMSASIPLPFGTVQDAVRCLFSSKSKVADKYCFCLFIDGLDEFRSNFADYKQGKTQNNYDISELARRLMEWCQDEDSNTKMVFSSRVIPALDNRFPAKEKILLHLHTRRDILQSAFSNFKRLPEAIPEDYVELSKVICEQAQGVFLWARLVIKDILEAFTDGIDPSTFRDRIEETPTDITDLYARILDRVKDQDREASAMILRLAAFQPARFTLNTLVCAWLDKLKNANFPCNEPACLYSDDVIKQQRQRAIQRLAALTHGILEAQDVKNMSRNGEPPPPLFQSEIVFLHRTAQDFIRNLLARKVKGGTLDMLPWLQGDDNVSADDWPRHWRTNLFVRIFHAEVRFGITGWEGHGELPEDILDFGFWDKVPEQLRLPNFDTLSDFSLFTRHYRIFHLMGCHTVFYQSGIRGGPFQANAVSFPSKFSLQWAVYQEVLNISVMIKTRPPSRRLSSWLALTYSIEPPRPLDGLEWLLQNKKVHATDKRPVWFPQAHKESQSQELYGDCSCEDSDGRCFQDPGKPHKLVQIWLIKLYALGFVANRASTEPSAYFQDFFERHCQVLEMWLRYTAVTDAIILITSKKKSHTDEIEAEDIFYLEIEQLLQLEQKPLNFQSLQNLLARWRNPWSSWIPDRLWNYQNLFQKKTRPSAIPIRSRYRHMSTQELYRFEWRVHGVISEDDELLGNFYCQIA